MADPVTGEGPSEPTVTVCGGKQSRKEKRMALKKLKRKQIRKEAAIREKEEEEARLNDPEEELRLRLREQEDAENLERERREFEERERLWLEAAAARKTREEEEERRKKLLEEEMREQKERACGFNDDDEYDYVEEGPAEIIWQGNEIIVKKKMVKVAKRSAEEVPEKEDDDRPTSNPLPPQFAAFSSYMQSQSINAEAALDNVTQQIPNFGTEQDKAHCPFHLKTGACRFGSRCSRVHFYPEESCTLLIKNMYNGPGLSCEQDEGLEYTDEEVQCCYEEFYEDVHTEFLKFGEIVNFKVCKNSSHHLRGNVYVHYKSLESAILAYNTMSARYYAGKQIICEFVGVTRWKVAICGEYMKSRLKTCSHGSACNFIHCFYNPGGDYEWADWDNPPPKYWIKKMAVLFGHSGESGYEKELESEDYWKHKDSKRTTKPRSHRRKSGTYHYDEMELSHSSSDGEKLNSRNYQYKRHSITRKHSSRRQNSVSADENEQLAENQKSEEHFYSKSLSPHNNEAGEGISKEENGVSSKKHGRYAANIPQNDRIQDRKRASEDGPSSRRKSNVYSGEQENPECNDISKYHKQHIKKHFFSDPRKKHGRYAADIPEDYRILDRRHASEDRRPSSRRKRNAYSVEQENPECNDMSKSHNRTLDSAHCRERSHNRSNVESFCRRSFESQDQYNGRYSSGDLDSDKDSGEVNSLSGKRRKYEEHSSQFQRSQRSNRHQYNADEFRKGKSSSEKLSSDESTGRWKLSGGDYLLEESY